MKVLIHNERSDALDFLLGGIVNHGYKAGIANDAPEIIEMLSDERYNVVLTNGGYKNLDADHLAWIKSSSVFIIDITDQQKYDEAVDSKVDLCLRTPFEASKLWQAISPGEAGGDDITRRF
jgi:DNA-binding response OmpR family regulator